MISDGSLPGASRPSSALPAFFALVFAGTWAFWYAAGRTPAGAPRDILLLVGTFMPAFVALAFTARESGRAGVGGLLARLVDWNVPARWYVFALTYTAGVKLFVALLHRAVTGAWPRFGTEPWYLMLAATFGSTLVGGQSGEELGWRGFALPRLANRFGLGGASVLLGIVWAVWHLPLFFFPGADTEGQSFPVFLLQVTALSVAMGWLYSRVGGSLLPLMLFHAAVNNTKDVVPSAEPGAANPWALSHSLVAWLAVGVFCLCAALFLVRMKASRKDDSVS